MCAWPHVCICTDKAFVSSDDKSLSEPILQRSPTPYGITKSQQVDCCIVIFLRQCFTVEYSSVRHSIPVRLVISNYSNDRIWLKSTIKNLQAWSNTYENSAIPIWSLIITTSLITKSYIFNTHRRHVVTVDVNIYSTNVPAKYRLKLGAVAWLSANLNFIDISLC